MGQGGQRGQLARHPNMTILQLHLLVNLVQGTVAESLFKDFILDPFILVPKAL